jgi:RimJ/RimL family protein N-acetyltransferase
VSTALSPVTLEGALVRLEPLTLAHLDPLAAVGLDPDLWSITVSQVRDRDELRQWIEKALKDQAAGTALPFATIERASGKAVGSSRLANYSAFDRRIEIGWTWVARDWQRSGVNTEAKLLMLTHAFEQLGCVRVELKTDAINSRSRNAILRIGAREEGILRKHARTESGRFRDTVYFSITDEEWLGVKRKLTSMLVDR